MMKYPGTGSSAADEAMRLASAAHRPFELASSTRSAIEEAIKGSHSLADLACGQTVAASAAEKALRDANGVTATTLGYRSGSAVDQAKRDIIRARPVAHEAIEQSNAFAEAVRGLKGIDDGMFTSVKAGLAKYENATSALRDVLDHDRSHDPLRSVDRKLSMPIVPSIRNPILKTNELLYEMVDRLANQQRVIEASAEVQKRETELLGQLVSAFTDSQAQSNTTTRRSQIQAWIAIAVAVAIGAAQLITSLRPGY